MSLIFRCLDDDVLTSVLFQLPTRNYLALRLVSKQWARLIMYAWPAICAQRFAVATTTPALPPRYLWALATREDDDARLSGFLCVLDRLTQAWPDALEIRLKATGTESFRGRWERLQAQATARRLPADVSAFYLLGAALSGASPIGTLTGDFGPQFDPDTEREQWRVSLTWPPLREESGDSGGSSSSGGGGDEAHPPSEYSLQTFQEYSEFYDPSGVHFGAPVFRGADSLFLSAGFTEFTVHGTEMWLGVDCSAGGSAPASGGGEGGGVGGDASGGGGAGGGGLHFLILGESRAWHFFSLEISSYLLIPLSSLFYVSPPNLLMSPLPCALPPPFRRGARGALRGENRRRALHVHWAAGADALLGSAQGGPGDELGGGEWCRAASKLVEGFESRRSFEDGGEEVSESLLLRAALDFRACVASP